jgi:hypothetical protein
MGSNVGQPAFPGLGLSTDVYGQNVVFHHGRLGEPLFSPHGHHTIAGPRTWRVCGLDGADAWVDWCLCTTGALLN